jgi:ribosomal protein S12 methylthiotransferase
MDLPIQHCNGEILKDMNRKGDRESLTALINKLREKIPGITLRTTFITGFPGETEEDFQDTVHFIEKVRFLHLHIFPYSQREDTEAAAMPCQIAPEIKKDRASRLAEIQSVIKNELLNDFIKSGQKANVLFETYKDGVLKGHSDSFIEFMCDSNENLRGMTGTVVPVSTDGEVITGYLMSSSLS